MLDPLPHGDTPETTEAVMKTLRSYRWRGRVLAAIALSIGLLSIAVGIVLACAHATIIFPNISSMVTDYAHSAQIGGTNSTAVAGGKSIAINLDGGGVMSSADPAWRHVVATLMLGKAMALTSLSIALLGVGTLLTLLLTIFNRRVTLRQINASLAQISAQMKELQGGKGSGSAPTR